MGGPSAPGHRKAGTDATTVLVLSGAPLVEPAVGYGPFVMNAEPEIAQAIEDFSKGNFGQQGAEGSDQAASA